MWDPRTCFPSAPGTSASHLRSTGSKALRPSHSASPRFHPLHPKTQPPAKKAGEAEPPGTLPPRSPAVAAAASR